VVKAERSAPARGAAGAGAGARADAGAVAAVAAALAYGAALGVGHALPRYDCVTLVALLVGVFALLDRASPRVRSFALHATAQILLASFLVHLWTVGYEGRNAVFGGILPWSDSHDFYDDALRLVHGERFGEISSKRPIWSALLAGLLRISGGDLRVALVACAVVGAWAVSIAALAVWETHGARAAFVVFLVLLFFERRWTGFVQTEHVGLALGLVGFTLVWRANAFADADRARALRHVLVGIFAIATALMARAGAFFVLPALGFWAARRLAPPVLAARARVVALAAAACLAGFALHKAVLSQTGSGVTFSDYPAIAYGLVHEQDYTLLAEQHPELGRLPVGERVPAAWRIVTDECAADPMLVVTGLAKSGAGLFTSPYGIFSYVWTNPDDRVLEDGAVVRASVASHGVTGPLWLWRHELGTYSLVNAGVMGLLGGALVLSVGAALAVAFTKRRKDEELSLLRYTIAGVVLSAPFTPPWITSGQQVQTATLAFVAALPAVVFLGRRRAPPAAGEANAAAASEAARASRALVWVPFGFAAALATIILWLRAAPEPTPLCEAGGPLEIYPSTRVVVAASRSAAFTPKAIDDLRFSLSFLRKHNAELTGALEPSLREGAEYVEAFDPCDRHAKIVVDPDGALARARGLTRVPTDRAPSTPRVLLVQRPVLP
jgi:hypothetical protein